MGQYLFEEINNVKKYIESKEIPDYIKSNIKYNLFEWQEEAFKNFLIYSEMRKKNNISVPIHLMFNMATGTGKTLLMASLILELYKNGYRKFLFFVNQSNIVGKTENNFLYKNHTKYLFKEKIIINNKEINIEKVDNFTDDLDKIEIKFTTIQKLYNDIHIQRENQTTLDELLVKDIVMIADEAHHLNSDTKKNRQLNFEPDELNDNTTQDIIEKFGWEHTIIDLILNKNNKLTNNKNILLEFTATIPNELEVQKKYLNKIIYKFDLKEFLKKGYTKEINLISSTFNKKDRILQALLLNWYRHIIALKYNIPNFKPVILFRSKKIDESKEDYNLFLNIVNEISLSDFEFLKYLNKKMEESDLVNEQGKTRTQKVIEFLNGDFSEVVKYIKDNFKERNCIITNSETNTAKTKERTDENQEKLLNSLEDKDNHIRAIFTVDRLTEGWDVLNLYDIVRLYEGQTSGGKTKKTPDTTIKEIQLIGRGVRYFPFEYNKQIKNKRKFDNDLNNELRVLEELYFYTFDEDSKYISDLKNELKKEGYFEDDKIYREFKIKETFKKTDFYQNTKILINKQIKNPINRKKILTDLSKDFFKEYKISGKGIVEDGAFNDKLHSVSKESSSETIIIKKIKDFEKYIFRKALNIKMNTDSNRFNFYNLKEVLGIKSIDEIQNENILGNFEIKLNIPSNLIFDEIDNLKKLNIILIFLEELFNNLESGFSEVIGSEFNDFITFESLFGEPKTKAIKKDHIKYSTQIEEKFNLKNEDWYILNSFVGTSEERALIEFIGTTMNKLKSKYEQVFFLRNEEIYKIFDFNTGKGFQPDFLVFLKEKDKNYYYQVFIEPKGNQLLQNDSWKNEFLKEITKKYSTNKILKYEEKNYCLIGLPFYNKNDSKEFEAEYNKLV